MPTRCRFCGAADRKITNEHVWPEWLKDFVPTGLGQAHAESWSSGGGLQQWDAELLSATVKMFCDRCNSGWMSSIEGAARGIVGPMVEGTPTTLDVDAQRVVANWAVLKGLVAAQVSPTPPAIPDRHYQRVWAAQGAPVNTTRVWIGKRADLADPARIGRARLFNAHSMPITNVARQFPLPPHLAQYLREGGMFGATIFQVGHFFALALQHDWPGLQVRPVPGTNADRAFRSIWPTGSDVRWPPLVPVDVLGNIHQVTQYFQMRPAEVAPVGP